MSLRAFALAYQNVIQKLINVLSVLLVCIFVVSVASPIFAQRSDLETRRKQLLADIKSTTKELSTTRKNKEKILERFLALQQQIKQREELIATLEEEIKLSETNIVRNKDVVSSLHEDLKILQEEYAAIARLAYRQKINKSDLYFLFSANNFNEIYQRWRYLQQYDDYRQRQASLIAETQQMLEEKIVELEKEQAEKGNILTVQQAQRAKIDEELSVKDKLLKSLKSNEAKLVKGLEKQQADHQKLNRAIENIIREEIAKRKKEARTTSVLNRRKNSKRNKATTKPTASNFGGNKGRLNWPVSNATIVRPYGKQAHPSSKMLTINSKGIDIRTTASATVKTVYNGKVIGKQFIPSSKNIIIIQHGNYYTVYSNLEEVFVKRDELVKTGQIIGKVGADKPEVHFEVWRDKQHLNPISWIKRK